MTFAVFPLQAAGHPGMLFVNNDNVGVVYKLARDAEVAFYEQVAGDDRWRAFLPHYLGVDEVQQQPEDAQRMLKLEDLTHGFARPCVMDVKIGTSTVPDDANERKRREAHDKDLATTTYTLGLRICGMQVYDGMAYQSRDKAWGKTLDEQSFRAGVRFFFEPSGAPVLTVHARRQMIACKAQLERLLALLRTQRECRFCATSLLFVYEAAHAGGAERGAIVRLIDMAHVTRIRKDDSVGDNGCCMAVTNLIAILQEFID